MPADPSTEYLPPGKGEIYSARVTDPGPGLRLTISVKPHTSETVSAMVYITCEGDTPAKSWRTQIAVPRGLPAERGIWCERFKAVMPAGALSDRPTHPAACAVGWALAEWQKASG